MKKNSMRILISILLCGIMLFAALPFAVSAEDAETTSTTAATASESTTESTTASSGSGSGSASVSVGSASGKAGDTVTVDVKLNDNPGVIAMNLGVDFDSNQLELVGVNNTGVLNGFSSPSDYSGNHYTLNWEDGLATTNNNGTGTVATLTFKLKEDCDNASVNVSGVGHNADVNTVSVSGGKGTITNTAPKTTTAAPTTTTTKAAASTTKAPAATTTKRAAATSAMTRSYNQQNTYPVDYMLTEPETTAEESTTDLLSLWETMTETTTMLTTMEESTTELEDQPRTPLSKTKLILIILMACFAIVGVAIIVSMVRKSKG